MLTNEDMIAIAAECDRELAGVCIASLLNCVDQLVVAKPYRRQGVCRLLLSEMEKRAKRLGAQRLDLIVWSFNQEAIAVYEKCGMLPQRIIYEKAL